MSKYNQNFLTLVENIENITNYLYDKKLISYYSKPKIDNVDGVQSYTWHGHVSGRENCGKSFTTIKQYKHMLETGAFQCILFDGSILRATFSFENQKIIHHSYLWWPSPFEASLYSELDSSFYEIVDMLEGSSDWIDYVRMRSPIRVDFDPDSEKEDHPLVHMHTQHHETRMHLVQPITFNTFIKYIFTNYYPDMIISLSDWFEHNLTFPKAKYCDFDFSTVLI